MLEYSDYKSLVNTLEQSNHDNTYQELINKEDKVLDTVNRVIKNYRDDDVKEKEFINHTISQVVYKFFNIWIEMFNDLLNSNGKDIFDIFSKDDRLVYIGIMFIFISIFLYYVEISKSSKV
jgi:hypothetical protein